MNLNDMAAVTMAYNSHLIGQYADRPRIFLRHEFGQLLSHDKPDDSQKDDGQNTDGQVKYIFRIIDEGIDRNAFIL